MFISKCSQLGAHVVKRLIAGLFFFSIFLCYSFIVCFLVVEEEQVAQFIERNISIRYETSWWEK